MRLLIPTQTDDIHAKVVQRALAKLGHQAVLWFDTDLPQRATASMHFSTQTASTLSLCGPQGPVLDGFDRMWWRRPTPPVLPAWIHPGDRGFVEREWHHVVRSLDLMGARDAWCVNPMGPARDAECKPWQLHHAVAARWTVPETLMSNDPDDVRAFVRRHEKAGCIYKPFISAQWTTDHGTDWLFTSAITEADLPDDETLAACPGIYQPRIPKAYELRVTVMGEHLFVHRIASQAVDDAQLDWRAGTRAVEMVEDRLPPEVAARVRGLMARMGLVFGCLDIIVTPSGEHVFLELNQMGQWLWLEELVPELSLLDAFCHLLIAGRTDFAWRRQDATLSFSELRRDDLNEAIDATHVAHPSMLFTDSPDAASP